MVEKGRIEDQEREWEREGSVMEGEWTKGQEED